MTRPDPAVLAALRARIWALERSAPAAAQAVPVAAAVDPLLPWGGLPLACLHEILDEDAAATGFCALLLGRLARRGPVVWCMRRDAAAPPYPPGLAAFGLPADRLILVRAGDQREVLWAMEEALRCPEIGGVLGEVRSLDLTAGRRLQLAAEAGGVTGLVLLQPPARSGTAATTRWRVAAAPAAPTPWGGLGPPRWHVALERCRGAPGRRWLLEWREETGELAEVETP